MKWMVIKGVRYPSSVISAFAAYNMDNPFLKVRIRNKYHIVPFDDVNKMASQMVYLMDNYPDFVQIGRWWISKKHVMSWAALPVEPACMGKAVGEAGRPLMLCGARLYIITFAYTKDHFMKIRITYNNVIQRGWRL